MIRIAVCDDDKRTLDQISGYINSYAQKCRASEFEVLCFDCATALIGALEDGPVFDIFVLDVYIGDKLGTSLAKDIRKAGIESPIIFATTSLEHAPESFETGTLRYLIKPIDQGKFYEALDVALKSAEKIGRRLIKLKTENGIERINLSHIIYSESRGHYQYMTLDGGKQLRVRMTVTELYTFLAQNGGFVRVGSSYIINLRNVRNVTTAEVDMYNGIAVPIPRGKHVEIKKAFWDFQSEE